MKKLLKNVKFILIAILSLSVIAVSGGCELVESSKSGDTEKIQEFYDKVVESQICLDEVADDIYRYWYDAIYKDKHLGNIDYAIALAQEANEENLEKIEENDLLIKSLYKKVKDSKLSTEIKEVMSAYSDYYEFVVNVSGSFNSYSESKEDLKKELASALKKLSLEI